MPSRVAPEMWIALAGAWLVGAVVLAWMKLRWRRRIDRSDWFADTPAVRRVYRANRVISSVCAASALVPILAGASSEVTAFWLLAIPPAAYAGLWLVLGVVACLWLAGWRPQSRP